MIRVLLVASVVFAFWASYLALTLAIENQRLPAGGYGELYGPLSSIKFGWFWLSIIVSIAAPIALLVVSRETRLRASRKREQRLPVGS